MIESYQNNLKPCYNWPEAVIRKPCLCFQKLEMEEASETTGPLARLHKVQTYYIMLISINVLEGPVGPQLLVGGRLTSSFAPLGLSGPVILVK